MIALRTGNEADFIYPDDPALDTEAPDFAERYQEFTETGDRSRLPMRDDGTPTVFRVKRMSNKAFEHCLRQQHDVDRLREAVCYGLVKVENFGEPGVMTLEFEKGDLGEQRLSRKSLEKIYVWDVLQLLGLRILSFQTLPPTKGRR
jgi:hypothetical protein